MNLGQKQTFIYNEHCGNNYEKLELFKSILIKIIIEMTRHEFMRSFKEVVYLSTLRMQSAVNKTQKNYVPISIKFKFNLDLYVILVL